MESQAENDFYTDIPYIARDPLYEHEKAFSADFIPDSGDSPDNHLFDPTRTLIRNMVSPGDWQIDVHGFCVLNGKSAIPADDVLNNTCAIESAYIEETEALIYRHFPEYSRIETMNFIVRHRDARYPSADPTATVTHEQPAGIPHSDFSFDGGPLQIDHSFPGQFGHFKDKDWDLLNVWRPLIGPNDDWPLAVCDWNSIDVEKDIILNDDLHRDRCCENSLLHPSDKYRWYYIKGQMPEDVFVFRNTDSNGTRARGFHAAVRNPSSTSPPRCSAEVRVVAIR